MECLSYMAAAAGAEKPLNALFDVANPILAGSNVVTGRIESTLTTHTELNPALCRIFVRKNVICSLL